MIRFLLGLLAWCAVLWSAEWLFGIDPTFSEMVTVFLAATLMNAIVEEW